MQQAQNLWTDIIEELKRNFDPVDVDEVFQDTKVVDESNGLITILVPSVFLQNKITSLYIKHINTLSKNISQSPVRFKILIEDDWFKQKSLVMQEIVVNDEEQFESNLNESLTFDTFVSGSSNLFAVRTAMMTAENPGLYGNPLYIFGGVGLGKTHLMQSIGNYILDKDITKKVCYVQTQNFISEFSKASQNKTIDKFKEKYNSVDVLLVDDIQMLASAKKTQEEFFNLFNNLYNNNKQIVITSDRPSSQLKDIVDRLTSRFAVGLQSDIKPYNLEDRVNILKRKLQQQSQNIEISDDILRYISNLYNNIRELEGGLKRVLAYSTIFNQDITMELVENCLGAIIPTNGNDENERYENLKSIVANYYNISMQDLIGKSRKANIVLARHVCIYILKNKYNLTYKKIGELLGGKDHSTIMSGNERIENDMLTDSSLVTVIDNITKKIS